MKKTMYSLSALALAVSMGTQANSTGDVQVGGTIAPSPCVISFDKNEVDFGTLVFSELEAPGDRTWLAGSSDAFISDALSLSISCSSGVGPIGLRATSSTEMGEGGRPGLPITSDAHLFYPLGLAGNTEIEAANVVFTLPDGTTLGSDRSSLTGTDLSASIRTLVRPNAVTPRVNYFATAANLDETYTFDARLLINRSPDVLDPLGMNSISGTVSVEVLYF